MYVQKESEDYQICSFCGNKISKDRWSQLESYFDHNVTDLKSRIQSLLDKLQKNSSKINEIEDINENIFYLNFKNEVLEINSTIKTIKLEYLKIIESLTTKLKEKQDDVFSNVENFKIEKKIKSINDLFYECNYLIRKNNEYSKNLENKANEAKKSLINSEVNKLLSNFKYEQEISNLRSITSAFNEKNNEISKENNELSSIKQEISDLRKQTVNEQLAVDHINKKLNFVKDISFQLINVQDRNQKGQYKIKDKYSDEEREITELSTGEKNIVAFLWFIYKLKENDSNNKVIVFDDPMNSNDDNYQYLIMSEIDNLLYPNINKNTDKVNYDKLFILTHNANFYINTRYHWRNNDDIYKTYHLFKVNGKTSFKKINNKTDFRTKYDSLWCELRWLYDNNQNNLMLNPIRRILETFRKFNNIQEADLYEDSDQIIKNLNMESHGISIDSIDVTEKTCDDIIADLRTIFINIGAEKHFSARWDK